MTEERRKELTFVENLLTGACLLMLVHFILTMNRSCCSSYLNFIHEMVEKEVTQLIRDKAGI